MPQRPLRPCKRPGCPAVTRNKDGYCDEHKQYAVSKKKQYRRGKKTLHFYGTARWQRCRNWYKKRHPLCEDCLERGKFVPVYCVDHIIEIKDGGAELEEDNLRSLCRRCHSVKTADVARERNKTGE